MNIDYSTERNNTYSNINNNKYIYENSFKRVYSQKSKYRGNSNQCKNIKYKLPKVKEAMIPNVPRADIKIVFLFVIFYLRYKVIIKIVFLIFFFFMSVIP